MSKSLVVVESPAKAKTINKYLGKDYTVKASMGHIKDLPKSKLGVDEKNNFEPQYVIIRGKADLVKELKKAAEKADDIYLATDPDREGEAISFHLAEELGHGKKLRRVILNEITKDEVLHAFANPTEIDQKKVQAQQARRILDRIVGYKISPLLWEKVKRGLSAGRVQSIALRLICDREREIQKFVPEEFWTITAFLEGHEPPVFPARLARHLGKKIKVTDQAGADQAVADLNRALFVVEDVEKKERKRHAPAPYITSKLQQEASRKFRWPVKKVMMVAQELYEGIELGDEAVGLITYMRTDSVRISPQAVQDARKHVHDEYGAEYLPAGPNFFKNKKSVQDAHEAIRPTSVSRTPESIRGSLSRDEYKLYELIWHRFVASQMTSALFDETIITVKAGDYEVEASGQVMKFAGYLRVYQESDEESADQEAAGNKLPVVEKGEELRLDRLEPKQNFTQPPPRFTEAALVKELEDKEIGRPSTYAAIISVIQNRSYVVKEENRFKPTDLGFLVSDLLVEHFFEIMDFKYTAHLEEELDEIEEGTKETLDVLKEFYTDFSRDLEKAYLNVENIKATGVPTDQKCPQCGSAMVKRWGKFGAFLACTNEECKYTQNPDEHPQDNIGHVGSETEHVCLKCGKPLVVKVGRYGKFLACSGYPDCKFTATLTKIQKEEGTVEVPGEKCPQCGSELVVKQGRFGPFVACSNYPECKYIKPKTIDIKCPEDGGDLVEKRTRGRKIFYGCANYPDCKFALWNKPVRQECPVCHNPFMLEKFRKGDGAYLECYNKDCKYQMDQQPETEPVAT